MASYSTYKPEHVCLHVVAGKAFALGAVSAICICVVAFSHSWNSSYSRVALYTLTQCVFHTLEFFITAIYNTEAADDDSFILNDRHLHYAYLASIAESVLKLKVLSYNMYHFMIGLVLIGVGQFFRSLAMYTAGVSFNHHIQKTHTDKHKLVTKGVYKFSRHPSYFGYFWWFVGTQILLQNWIMAIFGAFKLMQFFRVRIEYEEKYLVSFFGNQYITYKAHTPVRIPWVK